MKIGNFSVQQQNQVSDPSAVRAEANNLSVQSSGLPQSLSSISAGQVFEATITRDESGKITIHLANGESVTARMDGAVELLENTATFFQVKSHQGNQLALRAVTQDPSANPTIVRALTHAGVAVDDANIKLVLEMMKNQLPIDAKSLAQMVRTSYANKGVDPATLAQMTKLGLPVTQENVSTFKQYLSGNGDMVKQIESMMKQLPQQLERFDSNTISGKDILNRLEQIFVKGQEQQGTVADGFAGSAHATAGTGEEIFSSSAQQMPSGMQAASGEGPNALNVANVNINSILGTLIDGNNLHSGMENTGKDVILQQLFDVLDGLTLAQGAEAVNEGEQSINAQNLQNPQTSQNTAMLKSLLEGPNGFGRLLELTKKMDLSDEQLQALFANKGFAKLLTEHMEKEWFLEPKQVQAKEVGEVYERLQDQMNKLESLMQQLNPEAKNGQDAGQIRNNVTFINDLNQLYNYVQIPLKMINGRAKGDLYVYTDKRALKQGKEELTAHLHLELEHLGMTDVYVSLREKKLTTNFIMEKEESLDLVMSHMDELTKRLEEKGFYVKTEARLAKEGVKEPDFFTEIINKELPMVAIQRYSLDVIV